MFLELAENNIEAAEYYDPYQERNPYLSAEGDNPYVFIPGMPGEAGVYVREDYFDNLTEEQFDNTMAYLDGVQQGMSGIGNFFRKMKARRQERKQKKRDAKHTRKLDIIAARGEAGTGIGGALKGIVSAFTGGGALPPPPPFIPQPGGGLEPLPLPPKPMNWTPIIIGGIALLVVGGMMRAQRRRTT